MPKDVQLYLWAVLSLAATGYPVRNVLLLVADDAGLEVSQNSHVISWWTGGFCLVPFAHFLLCCQLAENSAADRKIRPKQKWERPDKSRLSQNGQNTE
jgi:hypothetical protein